MSSSITRVRSIIQDQPLLVLETLTLDGMQKSARLKYFPVIGTSVTGYTFAAPTIDEQSGLLTWATAPAAADYPVYYKFVSLLDSTIQDLFDVQEDDGSDVGSVTDVRLVAASALDAIATSQALILKKIELLDLKTDGPSLAASLRVHAESLRDQVLSAPQESAFDIAEEINDVFGFREKIIKDWMRESE